MRPDRASQATAVDELVDQLSTEFVARQRRGENPTVDEYVASYPHAAEAIRALFPTIIALEKMRLRQDAAPDGRASLGPRRPTRMGDFRIVREIGRGGMGVVFEAVQESLGRTVAIKVLSRHDGGDQQRRRRFVQEAQIAGKLHHTNIVPVLGVGTHEDLDYFAMQWIDGRGLDRVLSAIRNDATGHPTSVTGFLALVPESESPRPTIAAARESTLHPNPDTIEPPPVQRSGGWKPTASYWRDLARIGLQASRALAYAHRQQVLHRDVKPANLLLDKQGTVWMVDFGLAKVADENSLSRTGEMLGTFLYAAPEQLSGQFDARSDIFSLGVTLHELATLELPYGRRARLRAMAGHATSLDAWTDHAGKPPRTFAPTIPHDLETILAKAIAESPSERYATAGELADDLQRFLDDLPPRAQRATWWQRWRRWARKSPTEAILTATSAALLLLVALSSITGWAVSRAALSSESSERQRATDSVQLALDALDASFEKLAGGPGGVERVGAASTVVSPDTAKLLEDLLPLYEELVRREGATRPLGRDLAVSTARLGDIQIRLGEYAAAIAAYRKAAVLFESLDSDGAARLALARIHNQVGIALDLGDQREASRLEFEKALEILGAPGDDNQRLELARAHYLLGRSRKSIRAWSNHMPRRPDGKGPPGKGPPGKGPGSNGPGKGGPGKGNRPFPPLPEEFMDFARGKGPLHGPPRGLAPDDNRLEASERLSDEDRRHLELAKNAIQSLVESKSGLDARFLLASCLRELSERDSLSADLESIAILNSLVEEYPLVADMRYELADTLARFDPRRIKPDEAKRGEQRLTDALAHSRRLVETHPYAIEYLQLHLHILHKLANVRLLDAMRMPPGFEHSRQLVDAVSCCEEAIRRQGDAIERFPNDPSLRLWRWRFQVSLSEAKMLTRDPNEAIKTIENGISDLEQWRPNLPRNGVASANAAAEETLRRETLRNGLQLLSDLLEENARPNEAKKARERMKDFDKTPLSTDK